MIFYRFFALDYVYSSVNQLSSSEAMQISFLYIETRS